MGEGYGVRALLRGRRYVKPLRAQSEGKLEVVEFEEKLLFRISFMRHGSPWQSIHFRTGGQDCDVWFKLRAGLSAEPS